MFGTLWRCVPDESVYVNGNPAYIAKPTADINNPVALIDKDISGYRKNITKLFSSTFDLTLKVPHVKGLELKGKFSYDNTIQDNTVRSRNSTNIPTMRRRTFTIRSRRTAPRN